MINEQDFLEKKAIELCRICEEYLPQMHNMETDYRKAICTYEIAKGGASYHRGYYSPSPVHDIITTNTSRGRLIKKPSKNGKFDYCFGFDANGRLILVDWFESKGRQNGIAGNEILLYHNDRILSIGYKNDSALRTPRINYVSESVYVANRIVQYIFAAIIPAEPLFCSRIVREQYAYNDNGRLSQCQKEEYYRNILTRQDDIFAETWYKFKYDQDGTIDSYSYDTNMHFKEKLTQQSGSVRLDTLKAYPCTEMPIRKL